MIVGVCGLIGSGKNTVADFLVKNHSFREMAVADSLKEAVAAIFNWNLNELKGITKESRIWREKRDDWWSDRLGIEITPRWVLQNWGTEVCRQGFHEDIWIASVENKLSKTKDNIVITDCRFPNEIDTIKKMKGIVIRIERGSRPDWYDAALSYNKGELHNMSWVLSREELKRKKIHASEYSSVGLDYDYVVDNNGTIQDLENKINEIILEHKKLDQ